MTDGWLMEADCIHGVVWYECQQCEWPSVRDAESEIDARYSRLLMAARVWRASLIPKTSSSTMGPTAALLRAIEALD